MGVRTALGMADAHTHTGVFRCAKRTINGLDAVVSAGGASGLDLDAAEIKVHVVMDYHDMIWFNLVVRADGSHRIAGIVHVGQRFGQKELHIAARQVHYAFAEHGQPLVIGEIDRPAFRQQVGGHESHVVARSFVLGARIAQSCNQPEIRCHRSFLRSRSTVSSVVDRENCTYRSRYQ